MNTFYLCSEQTIFLRKMPNWFFVGIPDDADRCSGHADHRFRDDGDHDSGMMPITRSGMIPIS
jgi:hypothetical protein